MVNYNILSAQWDVHNELTLPKCSLNANPQPEGIGTFLGLQWWCVNTSLTSTRSLSSKLVREELTWSTSQESWKPEQHETWDIHSEKKNTDWVLRGNNCFILRLCWCTTADILIHFSTLKRPRFSELLWSKVQESLSEMECCMWMGLRVKEPKFPSHSPWH